MKRLCCYCKRLIGHKCRNCGNDNATLLFSKGDVITAFNRWRDVSQVPDGWLKCLVCAHKWPAENDGATHGICAECFEKHRPRSGGPVADATGEP